MINTEWPNKCSRILGNIGIDGNIKRQPPEMSEKRLFLKISQYSQVFSWECCGIFKNSFLYRTRPVAASKVKWCIWHIPPPRHWNTDLVSSGVSLTSWGEGASLALVGYPSSDGITIKIPYGVDVLLCRPASHPIFSYWVG